VEREEKKEEVFEGGKEGEEKPAALAGFRMPRKGKRGGKGAE